MHRQYRNNWKFGNPLELLQFCSKLAAWGQGQQYTDQLPGALRRRWNVWRSSLSPGVLQAWRLGLSWYLYVKEREGETQCAVVAERIYAWVN